MIGAVGPVAAGGQLRLGPAGFQAGPDEHQPDHRRGGVLRVFGRQDARSTRPLLNSIELPLPAPTPTRSRTTCRTRCRSPRPTAAYPPIPPAARPSRWSSARSRPPARPITCIRSPTRPRRSEHGLLLAERPDLAGDQHGERGHGCASVARQPDQGGVRPVPLAAARRLGLHVRLWHRRDRPEQRGWTQCASNIGYAGPLPAERHFRSLSFPDINLTIMRPAALPPSTVSKPAMLPDASSTNPAVIAVANAQALLYQPTALPTTGWYFSNGAPRPPICRTSTGLTSPLTMAALRQHPIPDPVQQPGAPIVYTGDPGVRNPLLSHRVYEQRRAAVYPAIRRQTTNTVPAGMPLPVNVAFPSGTVDSPSTDSVVMPPAIPPGRLFQAPDGYGSVPNSGYLKRAHYQRLHRHDHAPAGHE